MEETKIESYSLYQTFRNNIPDKDLTTDEKKQLESEVGSLKKDQKVAFLRLILEPARIEDNFESSNGNLPYNGEDTEEGPCFDVGNLPRDLRWILLRFLKVCQSHQETG